MRVEVNGARLWFDSDGMGLVWDGTGHRSRPTVVLVHGGPGSFDHSYFTPEFDRLTDLAQVVYLDLRGHGRSTWDDPAEWSLEQCADDLRSFCDVLGIERPIVLGHSMGGPIVLLYGARHPGHAAGIVVQSGFARWDAERLVAAFSRLAGDAVGASARRDFAGEAVTEDESARVYAAFGVHLPDETKRAKAPQNLLLNSRGMDVVRRTDILDQLSAISSPTLVCVGEKDPVTPVAASEEIVAALPASLGRLVVIEGAGHFTWLDAPDVFWPVLIDFIVGVWDQAHV
jgi:pimeloyl-ACP methyl ester carboxylesterase